MENQKFNITFILTLNHEVISLTQKALEFWVKIDVKLKVDKIQTNCDFVVYTERDYKKQVTIYRLHSISK